jgi:hypothetical protein
MFCFINFFICLQEIFHSKKIYPLKTIYMKAFKLATALFILMYLTSCGIHSGLTNNTNIHNTTVELSKANYKVVQYVSESTTAQYVFGIGGLKKSALIENARVKMISHADMIGKPRAIINETVEVKRSVIFFITKIQVTISAMVIEFEKEDN